MAAVLGVHQTAGKELFITFMTFAHSHLDSTFSTTKTRMKAWDSWQKQRKIEEMLFWKMAGKMNVLDIYSYPPPHKDEWQICSKFENNINLNINIKVSPMLCINLQGGINCEVGSPRKCFVFLAHCKKTTFSQQKVPYFDILRQNCLNFWI